MKFFEIIFKIILINKNSNTKKNKQINETNFYDYCYFYDYFLISILQIKKHNYNHQKQLY